MLQMCSRRGCRISPLGTQTAMTTHYSGAASSWVRCVQVTRQLEMEKAQLLEKKRREQEDRRRKQEELDQILLENRRKVILSAAAV